MRIHIVLLTSTQQINPIIEAALKAAAGDVERESQARLVTMLEERICALADHRVKVLADLNEITGAMKDYRFLLDGLRAQAQANEAAAASPPPEEG